MTGNEHLQIAIAKLGIAAEGNSTILGCANGLRATISAAGIGAAGIDALDPALTAEVSRLLFAVAPVVAEQTAGRLAAEHVFVGLGCMAGALTTPDKDRFVGLLAFAALLESELLALYFRDAIATGSQSDLAQAIARNPITAPIYATGPITTH